MAEVYSYNPDTSGSHPYSQPPVDARSIQSMSDAIAASPTAVQVQPDGTLAPINHRRVYETDTGEAPPYFQAPEELDKSTRELGLSMVNAIRDNLRSNEK